MPNAHLCTDRKRVLTFSPEFKTEVIGFIFTQSIGIVPVHKGGHIDVVDHQIQIAVVVQIPISGTVGKTGFGQAPLLGFVLKGKIALIGKCVVGDGLGGHGIDHFGDYAPFFLHQVLYIAGIGVEVDVILVGEVAQEPVGYKNVFLAVVVEIGHESAPAPIGSKNPRHTANFTKSTIAVVAL